MGLRRAEGAHAAAAVTAPARGSDHPAVAVAGREAILLRERVEIRRRGIADHIAEPVILLHKDE
jgi:hypothetical protein